MGTGKSRVGRLVAQRKGHLAEVRKKPPLGSPCEERGPRWSTRCRPLSQNPSGSLIRKEIPYSRVCPRRSSLHIRLRLSTEIPTGRCWFAILGITLREIQNARTWIVKDAWLLGDCSCVRDMARRGVRTAGRPIAVQVGQHIGRQVDNPAGYRGVALHPGHGRRRSQCEHRATG